jgi:hypothetical protein
MFHSCAVRSAGAFAAMLVSCIAAEEHCQAGQCEENQVVFLQRHLGLDANSEKSVDNTTAVVQESAGEETAATCSFGFPEVDVKYLPWMAGTVCSADTTAACCTLLKAGTPQLGCNSAVDIAAVAKFGADLMAGKSTCKAPQLVQESTKEQTTATCNFGFPEVDVKYLPLMAGTVCSADTTAACCTLLKANTPQLGCNSAVDIAAVAKFEADLMAGKSACKAP